MVRLGGRHRFSRPTRHAAGSTGGRRGRRSPERTRFKKAYLGYIDDVVLALERFDTGNEDEFLAPAAIGNIARDITLPARNPFRDVGRNDPCPCGSGKKAKRCCLAKT
jgi:uncharacterized protein YecA (UPF0149 family)